MKFCEMSSGVGINLASQTKLWINGNMDICTRENRETGRAQSGHAGISCPTRKIPDKESIERVIRLEMVPTRQ
jgi:hypothetical protein